MAIGNEVFSYLTGVPTTTYVLLSIVLLVGTITLEIWERPVSWYANGSLKGRFKTVSSTFQDVDFDWSFQPLPSVSVDVTLMVSKHCPIIGEHAAINFVTQ